MSKRSFVEDIVGNLERLILCYKREDYDDHHTYAISLSIESLIGHYLAFHDEPEPEPVYTDPETGEQVDIDADGSAPAHCIESQPPVSPPPRGRRLLADINTLLSELSTERTVSFNPESPSEGPPKSPLLKSLKNATQQLKEMLSETETTEQDPSRPDETGYVLTPVDPSAYIPVQDIMESFHGGQEHLSSTELKRLSEDYSTKRIRWTRPFKDDGTPSQNRRSIHAGDWARYIKRLTESAVNADA